MATKAKAKPKAKSKPKAVKPVKLITTKPTPERKRLTVQLVTTKLAESCGNVSSVAKAFGVTRSSVYSFINDHPELKEAMLDAREVMLDEAENALRECVQRREGWAVCFALKTIGKGRGYVERQELTGNEGAPLFEPFAAAIEKVYGKQQEPTTKTG